MTQNCFLAFVPFVSFVVCAPVGAQSAAPYAQNPSVSPAEGLYIYAKNGQSPTQQATDRYACHSWASQQTGFDSTRPGAGVAGSEYAARRDAYQRAISACLEARGYSVSALAPAAPAPPPAPAPRYAVPVSAAPLVPQAPELKYHALSVQIDGGYSVTAGTTHTNLDDGPNAGFGLTWTPTASLPLALRVDGSYSWFHASPQSLIQGGYTYGHEDIYGGDADLQLDLAHRSSRSKFYLFGGAGWYREETESRRVSWVNGTICGFFFCEPGSFPAVAAVERNTSNWHQSWNAGIGWETALADRASFFIEARYLRIKPNNSEMEFVPVRIGLRF